MADDDKAAGAVWTPVRVAEDLRDTVLGTLSAAAPASRLTMGDLDAPPMWAGRPTTCARPGRQVAAVLGALATASGGRRWQLATDHPGSPGVQLVLGGAFRATRCPASGRRPRAFPRGRRPSTHGALAQLRRIWRETRPK